VSAAQVDMRGKTCVVTGASNGIGKAAAVALGRMGAELVLICRDRARGEAAVAEVAAASGGRRPDLLLADLASQAEIRRLAAECLASGRPIHVLLNNAGVINLRREVTADGLEATFALNHLGYFLLTHLLLDRIRASAPARIVNVASDAHRFARGGLDFDDLQSEKGYSSMAVYGRSKLANILFTRELARRLEGSGVTVNAVHPGAVATGFASNNGWLAKTVMWLGSPFLRTPEKGAETSIYCCTAPELARVTGRYFANSREARPNRFATDDAAASRLFEVSAKLVGVPA
jgi:NAD(P)-dependent dehydrogenase (short-subunit alcohol dehydrogenase family)